MTTFAISIPRIMRTLLLTFVFVSGCRCTCFALTIGPVVEREVIIVEPGNPVQVMENKTITVKVQPLGKAVAPAKATINIGGGLFIMRWDWEVYEIRLKALRRIEESSPAMKELVKNAIEEEKKAVKP